MWFIKHEKWLGIVFHSRSSSGCSCLSLQPGLDVAEDHEILALLPFQLQNTTSDAEAGRLNRDSLLWFRAPVNVWVSHASIQFLMLLNSWSPHYAVAMNSKVCFHRKNMTLPRTRFAYAYYHVNFSSLLPEMQNLGVTLTLLLHLIRKWHWIPQALNTALLLWINIMSLIKRQRKPLVSSIMRLTSAVILTQQVWKVLLLILPILGTSKYGL